MGVVSAGMKNFKLASENFNFFDTFDPNNEEAYRAFVASKQQKRQGDAKRKLKLDPDEEKRRKKAKTVANDTRVSALSQLLAARQRVSELETSLGFPSVAQELGETVQRTPFAHQKAAAASLATDFEEMQEPAAAKFQQLFQEQQENDAREMQRLFAEEARVTADNLVVRGSWFVVRGSWFVVRGSCHANEAHLYTMDVTKQCTNKKCEDFQTENGYNPRKAVTTTDDGKRRCYRCSNSWNDHRQEWPRAGMVLNSLLTSNDARTRSAIAGKTRSTSLVCARW
ncbi:hypothetical protein Micbo1qcDRAFT_209727 [Microdochium bolleyi]|uniref:Uncharacterized protein n=1 Tax=Microdochium bolleyi TaxID=196109 RepID=A0A136ILE6_9PEZI|nr:hypothetical protein Micbo1qcDRAFT_209727 [Microdochium bolleyi]